MGDLLQSLFARVGGARQAAIIAVGLIVTALVYVVAQNAMKPVQVTLISNVPLAIVEKMAAKLKEEGIIAKLTESGTGIEVDSANFAKARVALGGSGLMETSRPGLELFDKPAWGMTDFTQKINLRRALEGELERNIAGMTDVKAVQVHLALEDDQIFKQNERPSKASVTLTMKQGGTPPEATVRGITRLVAGSVGGLTPDNVTVVDERGQALTIDNANSVTGLTSLQLAQQREVEKELRAKVEPLLVATYGEGNARVQLSALLNFDRVERSTQSVDPDKQALTAEQSQEVVPSTPAQGAAWNNKTSSFDYTRANESYVAAVGGIKKLTVAVLIADKVTMPIIPPAGDTTKKAKAAAAAAAAAAVPTITPRTAEELARAEALVRSAIGADSTRGDVISVVSAPFYMPPPPPKADSLPTPTLVNKLLANPKPMISIAALLVVLIVSVLVLGALRTKKPVLSAETQAAMARTAGYAELPAGAQMSDAMHQALSSGANSMSQEEREAQSEFLPNGERRPVVLPPPVMDEAREQAMATVEQRPDAAIRVVKAWLRADNI
jgi:flagellar M-ring protein FliF